MLPKILVRLIENMPLEEKMVMNAKLEKLVSKIWEQGYKNGFSDGLEASEGLDNVLQAPLKKISVLEGGLE